MKARSSAGILADHWWLLVSLRCAEIRAPILQRSDVSQCEMIPDLLKVSKKVQREYSGVSISASFT